MKIEIVSRRKKLENIQKEFPNFEIIDVTSKADEAWVKFSPFYPHGDIPVPFSGELKSESIEGLWQALKVFESHPIDLTKLKIKNMKGIKRTVRRFGKVLGHQKGTNSKELLPYIEARKILYVPSYNWLLENKLSMELLELKKKAHKGLVLLDYETNTDIEDPSKPLSHAALIRDFLLKMED